ncbi:MAG: VWA domain-containing protein [Proteobacteria bacterium]|nr:VWA domain-containing protein [Pseudomonadota bacterium]MBU1714738.1 VWA domain-containing protein [Pseudomonadota bacterium]
MLLAGCSGKKEEVNYTKGVYMLLDTSGTYTLELKKAQGIINYILGSLQTQDSFAVARIDSGSFSEKDIIHKVTFDSRPSVATNQKRVFAQKIDEFIKNVKSAPYTDISGGMLQAVEWLNEIHAGKKIILIFSDMEEELAAGDKRDFKIPLEGFKVVALNVTKLRADIKDPTIYLDRMNNWKLKVEESAGKGNFIVLNDLERLEPILAD